MANIRCASCKGTHQSVYAVRTCHQLELRIAELEAVQAVERDEDGEPMWCGECQEYVAEGRGWFHIRCSLINA